MTKGYIEDWIKERLGGKTAEEAGLSAEDLAELLTTYEGGKDPFEVHLNSLPVCACNICRS
jgi:hypothetical protein